MILLDERSKVFKYGNTAHSDLFSKTLVEIKQLNCRFGSNFQKVILFTDLLDELCIVSKCGFDRIELCFFIVS